MPRKLAVAALLLVTSFASADDEVMEALGATAGSWEGELFYLDYQSGERFSIPMWAEVEPTPDGATVVRHLTWSDPGNLVHAIVLSTIDRDTGELVEAFFREGKGEFMRYEVTRAEIDSHLNWTIELEHDGMDDNRPARIRHTAKRVGDWMTSRKSVRFLDDPDGEFFERNGTDWWLAEPAE